MLLSTDEGDVAAASALARAAAGALAP
jgi:hypothetical protein